MRPLSRANSSSLIIRAAWAVALLSLSPARAAAQIAVDEAGPSAELPTKVGDHWVWVTDLVLKRAALFDGDSGQMLGMVDSGANLTPKAPQWSEKRGEIYTIDRTYSRMHHGTMKDFVFIYDASDLQVIGEVELPPKVSDTATGIALVGMLDGDRFLAVLNASPGSSVSIVDLEARVFVGEIQTAGCAGIYPAGPRRFGMLCGNGTALTVVLTDTGYLDQIQRSAAFFDVVRDPISEKGVRDGARWIYTTFGGDVYTIDFSGDAPSPSAPWSLFSEGERRDGWRPGGAQYLAYHQPSQRLFSLVHEGGPGSHKDPGHEVWVWDSTTQSRVARFDVPNLLVPFIRPVVGFESGGFVDWLLRAILPNEGANSIAVTQDDQPLLFIRALELGAAGVLDATSGAHRRDLEEIGFAGAMLVVP